MVLAWVFEFTEEGIKREENLSPNDHKARRTGRKLTATVVVLAAIAAGVTLFRFLPTSSSLGEGGQNLPPTAIDPRSIAVLPFENLSDERSNTYFVSGMRDEILTSLAQLRNLSIRSRTSTQKYESHPDNLGSLKRELQVAAVLEGSVQKSGSNVLINVQLISADTGKQLWASSFQRSTKDVFGVQGEVAQQVADALKIRLAPEQSERLRRAADHQ